MVSKYNIISMILYIPGNGNDLFRGYRKFCYFIFTMPNLIYSIHKEVVRVIGRDRGYLSLLILS